LKHGRIDSIFDADSEYNICFDIHRSFLDEEWLNNSEKSTKTKGETADFLDFKIPIKSQNRKAFSPILMT
jgi:hypothetical protein